jgi:ribosomal-protein-alanine N-acetyltransferase
MSIIPTLSSTRLTLRPFTMNDAPDAQRLAGDREIADTTINIPHPYPDGAAEKWISTHQEAFDKTGSATWAVTLKESGQLIGAISLTVDNNFDRAEIGYWIAKTFWGQGYCTEAARAVLDYGFMQAGLNRIFAWYLTRNPASGKVMQKIGMKPEGCLRQHIKKWDKYEDLQHYGILKSEYHN